MLYPTTSEATAGVAQNKAQIAAANMVFAGVKMFGMTAIQLDEIENVILIFVSPKMRNRPTQ